MSSPQLVDDSNPAVQYVPGWMWQTLVNEVDGTRHGAAETGLSATLAFVGTGIQVLGTLQRSSGLPSATFTIDGEGNTTYSAPAYTSSQDAIYNVTFYSRRDLNSGNHELRIVNMNGTGTNVLWLDYFLIDSSPPISGTPSSSQTSTAAGSASSSGSSSPSASAEAAPSSSQPQHRGNTGAILGGVVGGVALLAAIGLMLLLLRRRRRKQGYEKDVQPYMANATRPSLEGSGHPSPSKSSYRPSSTDAESPSTRFTTTLDVAPASVVTSSRVLVAGGPPVESPAPSSMSPVSGSTAGPAQSTISTAPTSTPPPLEPLRSPAVTSTRPRTDSKSSAPGSNSASTPTTSATSPNTPLPEDIGQALSQASPELQSTAMTLIRSLLQRNQSQNLPPHRTEVDSGLRIYDEAHMMPPPGYTAD